MKSSLRTVPYFVAYGLICWLLLFGSGPVGEDLGLWPDWYTLVCRDGASIETRLPESLKTLSPRTAEVTLNSFDGEMRLPLSEVNSRLAPEDPRNDPFIQLFPLLFQAEWDGSRADVLYIPRTQGMSQLKDLLRQEIDAGEVLIADQSVPSSLPSLICFTAVLAVILILTRSYRVIAFLIMLPWGIGVFVSGREALYLALLGCFALPRILGLLLPGMLRRFHDTEHTVSAAERKEACVLAAGLILGMAFYGAYVSFVDFIVFPFSSALAGFCVVKIRLLYEERKRSQLLHPIFIHIPLNSSSRVVGSMLIKAATVALAMAFFVFLEPEAGSMDLQLPLPGDAGELSGDPGEALAVLQEYEKVHGLPTLAMYLTHRYYQENYLYAPEFILPSLNGGGLDLSIYNRENGHITRLDGPIWQFTEEWYSSIISDDANRIARFFIHDGVPQGILNTSINYGRASVYGAYPGFGLLFSLLFIGLIRVRDGRKRRLGFNYGRFQSRRVSQTA